MNVANTEQAAAWNGDDGRDWLDNEAAYNASYRRYTRRLFDFVPIAEDANVLDIGCGCGETTRLAAQRAYRGHALGIDLSAGMIARATERAQTEGIANATFVQGDAQVYRFRPATYDLAISRYGAMFFSDMAAAFRNIGHGLAAGGSLALLTWQGLERNPWMQAILGALAAGRTVPMPPPGAPGPFGLADVERTTELLTGAGFEGVAFTEIREPMYLGDSAQGAFDFISRQGISRGLLQGLDSEARDQALHRLRDVLGQHETADGVLLGSACWLVSATRRADEAAPS